MTSLLWIILGALHVLTLLWYFLIRKDVLGYLQTQIKLLGRENAGQLNNLRLRFLLHFYFGVLFVLMAAFTFYLYSL
jgi:hypothetical protein